MKRLFLFAITGALLSPICAKAETMPMYINNGIIDVLYPNIPPRIDARTFVNRGTFNIFTGINFYSFYYSPYLLNLRPYETWNTVNYTNFGVMSASPGFRFDYSSAEHTYPFNPELAANFSNVRSVSTTNASIYGETYLLVQATNIMNSGVLAASDYGYMRIRGQNINMTRGTVELSRTRGNAFLLDDYFGLDFYFGASGIQSLYWGVGTNDMAAFFSSTYVTTSPMQVTMFDRVSYLSTFYNFALTNGFTAHLNVSPGGRTDYNVDLVLLSPPEPGVTTEVRFWNMGGPSTKTIRWESVITNRVTGELSTNHLFLIDYLASTANPYLVQVLDSFGTTFNNMATYRPNNYVLTQTLPAFTNLGTLIPPQPFDPTLMYGTNADVFVTNTAYGARVTAEPHSVDPALAGATYSNVLGRIEINAEKVLDLTRTRIQGMSYLRVESTNHFVGSTNSRIVSPFSTFKLGTTNSSMTVANLLTPTVPCVVGDLEIWSGKWTNASSAGSVLYNVTIIDGRLASQSSSFIDVLELKAPNMVIADELNVITGAKIDTETLTIVTNFPTSPSERGELNFLMSDFVWSANLPRLRCMTNYGGISASNTIYFAGTRMPPYFTGTYEEPYDCFVNYGDIATHGNDTWARYYQFSGSNYAGLGPIIVRANDAILRNGTFDCPSADVMITAGNLIASNMVINAARGISLQPSYFLSDGSLESGAMNVTNKNAWSAGAGLSLLSRPAYGSLLATTVKLGSYYNEEVLSQWAAQDKGCAPDGFVNNAAIGNLVLDGANQTMFAFAPVGENNAIYVDRLELTNAAALIRDNEPVGLYVAPGMKVYFAQAVADGLDVSERLNGLSGGQFCWVSGYAGAFSSTNMVYPDGTTNLVNAALAASCDLDSDNDGTPNCLDASPITFFWTPPVIIVPPATNSPYGGDVIPTNPPAATEPPKIEHPEDSVPYSGLKTTVGSYFGLFYNPEGVTIPGSGFCKITVTSQGVYSGYIQLDGRKHAFTGRLSQEARGTNYVKRLGAAAVSLSFEVDDTNGKLEGTVSTDSWSGDFLADRVQANAKNKTPFAGRYTMAIPAQPNTGCGYGTVLVTTSGGLVWSGRMGDGSKVSQSSAVSREGVWPLYAATPDGSTIAISWVQFSTNDLGGKLLWIKAAGFTNEIQVAGSKYNQPLGAKRAIELFATPKDGHGRLIFMGGGVQTMTNTIVINNANKATFPNGDRVSLQIVPGTGLFQGKFIDPSTGKLLSFQGALLQGPNYGAGLFTNGEECGAVYLTKPAL